MDDEPPFKPGSQGLLLGCFAAVGFVVILSMPLLFAWAWGGAHCDPVPQCRREGDAYFLGEMAVVVILAILFAPSIRALYNWQMTRLYAPERAGRPPIWAAIIAIPLLLIMLSVGLMWLAVGF